MQPWQLLLSGVVGWMNRTQPQFIADALEEQRVLREQIGQKCFGLAVFSAIIALVEGSGMGPSRPALPLEPTCPVVHGVTEAARNQQRQAGRPGLKPRFTAAPTAAGLVRLVFALL
jgi:hypothetical protein